MFPKVPEDRSTLSNVELRTLARELRTYAREQLAIVQGGQAGDEDMAAAEANFERATFLAKTFTNEAKALEQKAADDADDAAALAAALAAEAAASDTGTGGGDDDGDPNDPPPAGGEDDDDGNDTAGASNTSPVGTSTGASEQAGGGNVTVLERIVARDGVAGMNAGDVFGDMDELAHALHARAQSINPATNEKFEVALIEGLYPAERKLGPDPIHNLAVLQNVGFVNNRDEVRAAVCAPLTPYYGLACESSLFRPVAASLNSLEAPRGGVITMSSPSLADFTNAGIWTHEDDDAVTDDDSTWKPCDTIQCGTPEEFLMYAVFWCLRIKNWTALTYPELVAAALNKGLASRARLAERQLLDAMGAGVATVNGQDLGYGSTVSVLTQILNYLAIRREAERWGDEVMDGWAHRWLVDALRIDQARRRQTGTGWAIPSRSEITQRFAEVGVDMTWYWDTPSWGTPVPDLTSGGNFSAGILGTLNALPSDGEILVAPKGKFRMIDRAQIQVGVTGNNLYRLRDDLRRNEFTFFVENYEGVVDTTSCDAHLLRFEGLCHNGRQIEDILIDCAGELEAA
jgi:hypothetical protein